MALTAKYIAAQRECSPESADHKSHSAGGCRAGGRGIGKRLSRLSFFRLLLGRRSLRSCGAGNVRELRPVDDALWQSVDDKRSGCSRAAAAAGDQKLGIMECLAFGPGVHLFAHGQGHEATICSRSAGRRRHPQDYYGRSATLALLDDGRATGSPRLRSRQTTDAAHIRTE